MEEKKDQKEKLIEEEKKSETLKEKSPSKSSKSKGKNKKNKKKKAKSESDKLKEKVIERLNGKEDLAKELIKQVDLTEKDEERFLKKITKSPSTVSDISEEFNIAKEDVWPFIDRLRAKGYEVVEKNRFVFLKEVEPGQARVQLPLVTKSEIKILFLSDIGIGLKQFQPDLLATAYKLAEEEGVFFAVVMDISAGAPIAKKRREYIDELLSFDDQLDYIAKYFPKASFKTYLLNGPKDLSHMAKRNLRNMAFSVGNLREDIKYLGDLYNILPVKNASLAVSHTENDASIYTKSYPLQGIIRNYQDAVKYFFEDSDERPDAVVLGGIYSAIDIPQRLPFSKTRQNNMRAFALPGLYNLTASQRIQKRQSGSTTIGCFILTLQFNRDGSLKDVIPDFRDWTAYTRKRNYLTDIEIPDSFTDDQKKAMNLLFKNPHSQGELSRKLKKASSYIDELIVELKKYYEIEFFDSEGKYKIKRTLKTKFIPLDLKVLEYKKAKVIEASDFHIGNEHSRADDLIPVIYQIAEIEKADMIHCSGDIFDGDGAYPGQEMELVDHGADNQREHGLKIFPKSEILTQFITGSSHELVFYKRGGHNIVETFCKLGRLLGKKLEYIGMKKISSKGFSKINDIAFQLIHPTGGIPFGLSYRPQKRIEQLVTIIDDAEAPEKILCCGHLHVSIFMMYKGMAGFLVPCTEEETGYLAGKGYIPWLGIWIVEVWQDKLDNITRIITRYVPFEPKEEDKYWYRRKKTKKNK